MTFTKTHGTTVIISNHGVMNHYLYVYVFIAGGMMTGRYVKIMGVCITGGIIMLLLIPLQNMVSNLPWCLDYTKCISIRDNVSICDKQYM